MPAVRRLCPAGNPSGSIWFSGDHGCDQVMHQPIVVSPTRNAGQPGLKQSKFGVAELVRHFLQQEYGKDFFFQNPTGEKLVCNSQKKVETKLFSNPAAETDGYTAQSGGIPSVRFDLVLEEPLHTVRVLSGTVVPEQMPDLSRDAFRGAASWGHSVSDFVGAGLGVRKPLS